jgi:hypothetical protein
MTVLTTRASSRVLRAFRYALLLLLGAFGMSIATSASAQVGTTSLGTDFWIGMMPNWTTPAENIRVFVASGTDNEVHCDFYGGSGQPVDTRKATIKANDVFTFFQYATALAEERVPEKVEYKAIHVYSKNPIAVYAITNSGATTDSYLGLPIQSLGTEYLASCYYDDHYNFGLPWLAGEFLIIAPYDDTHVTIHDVRCATRSDDAGTLSHQQGDTWQVSLQKGQTYLVQSTGLNYGDDDLTGTLITSDKPVGLISGHQRTSIPIGATNDSKDHLCEMYPPVDRWGSEYYDMPMAGRTICGDYIRLIAGEDNVIISENGNRIAQLGKKGDFVDRTFITDPVVYKSVDGQGNPTGKKFLVVQMAYSEHEGGDPGLGDPFAIIMTPREQFQTRILFRCPNNNASGPGGSYTHYATFITLTDSVNKIRLNDKSVTSYNVVGRTPIPGTNMSAIRIKALSSNAAYLATCGAPFALYLYGFTDVESYGHPAGMALRVVTPDPIAPAEVRDSACGTFTVQLQEIRHQKPVGKFDFEDSRINEVAMITDAGDLRWDKPSVNFDFAFDPAHPFAPGDSIAYYTLKVQDLTQDGYAAVWAVDRAGNDTLYEYNYFAPKVTMTPDEKPDLFQPVTVSKDSCRTFVFRNISVGDLNITGIDVLGSATAGKFTVNPSGIKQLMKPNDSLVFTVCFNPSDTVISDDTLLVQTECVPFRYALEGRGVTPIILADNLDFGGVAVGDTSCKDLKIKNIGNAPLVIDKNWVLKYSAQFFFRDASALPVTIQPGETRTFNFCYAPSAPKSDTAQQDWGTNVLAPFEHMKKDTSILSGYGLQPGLNWDRQTEGFTVECADTLMQRVYLVNPSIGSNGTDVLINKVQIEGPDAAEFTLTDNELHYLPLENTPQWPLPKDSRIWIDVTFKPDMTKGYRLRNAKIVAYGEGKGNSSMTFQPELPVTGTIRHSEIRITPPSHNFGVVVPGTLLSTDFWIHNDGDTDLVLGTLNVAGGNYSVTGYTLGQKLAPGDSIKVTVTGVAISGDMPGTLTGNGVTPCDILKTATIAVTGVSSGVTGTGYDYGDVYVCKNGTATVKASNIATSGEILASIRIIDTLGSAGASQYAFTDGTQAMVLNQGYNAGESHDYGVTFNPIQNGAKLAYILYTWIDTTASPDSNVYVLRQLTGNPLFYQTTLSVHKDYGDQIYSANTGENVSIPVQMKVAFDPKANVYGMTFTLRYRRDEFTYQSIQLGSGLSETGSPTIVPDPADNKFELLSATLTSGSQITALDTVAHVVLRYNIALDSTTPIEIGNIGFLDNTGTAPCWVLGDTISGTFAGKDFCGNATIRGFMAGNPVFSIRKVTPNPVTSIASLEYELHVNNAPVTIEVFDVLGARVLSINGAKAQAKGTYNAQLDVAKLGSGTYTVRVASMGFVESQQIVVQK